MTSPHGGPPPPGPFTTPGHSNMPPDMVPGTPPQWQPWAYGTGPNVPSQSTPPPESPRQIGLGWVIAVLAAVIALFTATLVFFVPHSRGGSSPDKLVNSAAAQLGAASALRLTVGFSGADGRMVDAEVTVTSDLQAAGTVIDPGGGKAELVATSDHTAVQGDTDFWARRAPEQIGKLVDKWVQPDSGSAFPIDVSSALNPSALAELAGSLAENATSETTETIDGKQVTVVESGSWTALFNATGSHDLVWMGGPILETGTRIHTASFDPARASRPTVRPALDRILPAQTDDVAAPPYISIAPTPTGSEDTRTAVAKVLPQASPKDLPPQQSSDSLAIADFQGRINASDCWSPTCSWTITVTNVGRGAGAATVYATVTPGMALSSFDLGTIPPGGSATTPVMTFANPVPKPAPGQTNTITMNYEGWINGTSEYSAQIADLGRTLQNRGINPQSSELQVDPGWLPTVLGAAKLMTDHAPDDETVANKALDAIEKTKEEQLLPELKAIVDSGRLLNPEDLARKLGQPKGTAPNGGDTNTLGYRREIEQAAWILRTDPTAHIKLDGDENGYSADILDVTNRRAYQVKQVSSDKLAANLKKAVRQLNGLAGVNGATGRPEEAPPGYQKIALIYIESVSKYHQEDKDGIERAIRKSSKDIELCNSDGSPKIDLLQVVTARGRFEWSSDQFGRLGAPCK